MSSRTVNWVWLTTWHTAVTRGQVRPAGSFTVDLAPGTREVSFAITRLIPGRASLAPFAVIDEYGAWQAFAGGGPSGS